MLRTMGFFCISVSAVVMFACSVDSPAPRGDGTTTGSPEAQAALPGDPGPSTVPDVPLELTSDDSIAPAACSVRLNFCDGPGAVGTDCTQTGCSEPTAINACKSLVSQVGCAVRCNAVMRNSAGTIIDTWRVQCGSVCCPQGDFCSGGHCCDGTCRPGCPC